MLGLVFFWVFFLPPLTNAQHQVTLCQNIPDCGSGRWMRPCVGPRSDSSGELLREAKHRNKTAAVCDTILFCTLFNLYVYWASQARSVWCYQPPNDSLFFFSCSLDCVQWETTVDTTWVNVFSVSNDHRGPNETLSWEDLCRKLLTPHFHFT